MKKFRFKYSILVWILLALVLLICCAGLYLNILNIVEYSWAKDFRLLSYIIICIMTLFVAVFVISVMCYGRYSIKNKHLYTYFGFIFTKTPVEEIVQITHFKKSNKLVIYYTDQKYSVIVISPSEYEQFILALRDQNKKIIYNTQIDGEQTPN